MTQDYYGTKRVTAWPEARRTATNGNLLTEGYAVKYEDGYTSWSPKATFEAAYQPLDALCFGHVLVALSKGHRAARKGWNGKEMFVFLVRGSTFKVNRPPLLGIYPEGEEVRYAPHIDIKTAQGTISTWQPSSGDMLAKDWMVLD